MEKFLLDNIQLGKIKNTETIQSPTSKKYIEESEKNNAILKEKINEYTEAEKNAFDIYVR